MNILFHFLSFLFINLNQIFSFKIYLVSFNKLWPIMFLLIFYIIVIAYFLLLTFNFHCGCLNKINNQKSLNL